MFNKSIYTCGASYIVLANKKFHPDQPQVIVFNRKESDLIDLP